MIRFGRRELTQRPRAVRAIFFLQEPLGTEPHLDAFLLLEVTCRRLTLDVRYIWCPDVETENTWKTGSTQFDYEQRHCA